MENTTASKPKKKLPIKKVPFNLRTVTAVLCAIVVLLSLLAFFEVNPNSTVEYRKSQVEQVKTNIANAEARIPQYEEDIVKHNKEIETLTAQIPELEAAVAEAKEGLPAVEEALKTAEAALDEVCTRSYYSSWYCSDQCKTLHQDVSDANTAYNNVKEAVMQCEYELGDCNLAIADHNEEIDYMTQKIASTKTEIQNMKKDLSTKRTALAKIYVALALKAVAMIMTVGALCLLVKNLFGAKVNKKFLFISCGAMGIAALLLLIALFMERFMLRQILLAIIINPNTYTAVAMAMYCRILMKKAKKPVVCRTIAIVATVISVFAGLGVYSALNTVFGLFTIVFYAIAMICLAFVVEPLVFTEYIKIAKHIFLSFITLGIWLAVWTYHVTKNLNKVEDAEERTPRNELLLCMFLPFYAPFWTFKTAEIVESYGLEKEKKFNLEVLALVFGFICPLFATVMIQNKINVAVGKPVEIAEEIEVEIVEAAEETV